MASGRSRVEASSTGPGSPRDVIGREEDLDALRSLVDGGERLISLIGPGGTGKTTLARALVEHVATNFDEVLFVDLMPADDSSSLLRAIESVLDLADAGDSPPMARFAERLASGRTLLVLDNCEQIAAHVAEVVNGLLRQVDTLVVLTTSLERLRLRHECCVWVSGLPVPRDATCVDAVELFVRRSRQVDHAFELTAESAPVARQICELLDGVPLAIELAAARTALYSVEELYDRLAVSTLGLRSTHRDRDPRHRSLEATAEWSVGLLTNDERFLFAELSVFARSFTLDGLSEVSTLDARQVEVLLQSLIDKSLVLKARTSSGATRYEQHTWLRQFADRLLDDAARDDLRTRHAAYFAARAATHVDALWDERLPSALIEMELDHYEYRSSLACLLDRGDAQAASLLAASLARYWDLRGHYREGLAWIRRAIETPGETDGSTQAFLLNGLGTLTLINGDAAASAAACTEAAELAEASGDDEQLAYALQYIGLAHVISSDSVTARSALDRSLAVAQQQGNERIVGWTSLFQAADAWSVGDLEALRERARVARELFERTGDSEGLGWAELALAAHRSLAGDSYGAASLGLRSLSAFGELHAAWGHASLAVVVSHSMAQVGRHEMARTLLDVSERTSKAVGLVFLPSVAAMAQEVAGHVGPPKQRQPIGGRRQELDRLEAALSDALNELSPAQQPQDIDLGAEVSTATLEVDSVHARVTSRAQVYRFKPYVGFTQLAMLIAHPNHDFAAEQLGARLTTSDPSAASTESGDLNPPGHLGARLDDTAITSYRARVHELQETLDHAIAMSDSTTAAAARHEIEMITDELSAAVGLAGRPRLEGDPSERARIRVTKSLRKAIRLITDADTALGTNLERSVKTGRFCTFSPDPTATVRWSVRGLGSSQWE